MKIYDFDGMFDEKLSEYIKKHSGEYKEKEWEDIVPRMYARFGDTTIKSLGKSPNQFYGDMTDSELLSQLKSHIKNGIPVSLYLCNAIEARDMDELLLPLLSGSEDELTYALNLIGVSKVALPEYMRLLTTSEDEDIRNICVDNIKELADDVKEEALENYEKGIQKEYMLEILSRCVIKDERIFEILLKEFRTSDENLSIHASYLASYCDERALPYLLDKIDEEGITFAEYQELKYAIESLGGTYEKERDFSSDPYYQVIKGQSGQEIDLFSAFKSDKKDD
ncbi:MAG: hypothetical protein ACI4QI_01225 [Candidatus Coproplasma sp.]